MKIWAFPGGSVVKNLPTKAGDTRDSLSLCRLEPWVRKIPWRRKWQPTPVFLPGKSHGKGGYGLQGHKELDTAEGTKHTGKCKYVRLQKTCYTQQTISNSGSRWWVLRVCIYCFIWLYLLWRKVICCETVKEHSKLSLIVPFMLYFENMYHFKS